MVSRAVVRNATITRILVVAIRATLVGIADTLARIFIEVTSITLKNRTLSALASPGVKDPTFAALFPDAHLRATETIIVAGEIAGAVG